MCQILTAVAWIGWGSIVALVLYCFLAVVIGKYPEDWW